MNKLLTFASPHYVRCMRRLRRTARPWFDEIMPARDADISANFKADNARLFSFARGWGFWIWKPWLLLQQLEAMKPGDVLMYCDSQLMFIDDPQPLFKLCLEKEGMLFFHQKREGHINRTWTRRDCFIRMGCDTPEYWNASQLNSAAMLWSPTPAAFALLREWLACCCDEAIVSDAVSVQGPELPEFKDHRHDQSILSLLAIKHNLITMPDPTQYGNGYQQEGRTYGQILESNRMVSHIYPIPCRSPQ